MKYITQVIIAMSILSFLFPCSCEEIPSPEGAYEISNVVFSGKVIDITEDWNNGFMEISIDSMSQVVTSKIRQFSGR